MTERIEDYSDLIIKIQIPRLPIEVKYPDLSKGYKKRSPGE